MNSLITRDNITRRCRKCGVHKLLKEFAKEKKGKWGVRPCCKKCRNFATRKYKRKYQKNNPEKMREKRRRYVNRNPEKVKKSLAKYAENNIEKVKDKARKNVRKRKAIKISTKVDNISTSVGILSKQGGRCANCGRLESRIPKHTKGHKWELDHIIPLVPKKDEQQGTHTSDYIANKASLRYQKLSLIHI